MDSLQLTDTLTPARTSENSSPLTDRQSDRRLSTNSISTEFTGDYENKTKSDKQRIRRIHGGSAYIKNYRFSRYQNAITSSIPYRRSTISSEELPIDGIGCFSNVTFAWSRKYLISKNRTERSAHDSLSLPRAIYSDSPTVNSKRLLGIYKYEEQTNGRISGSMFRAAWQFCQTRLIVAILMHMLSIILALIAIGLFLHLAFDSVHNEIQANSDIQNVNKRNYSDIAPLENFLHDSDEERNKSVKINSITASENNTVTKIANLTISTVSPTINKTDSPVVNITAKPSWKEMTINSTSNATLSQFQISDNKTQAKISHLNHKRSSERFKKAIYLLSIPICVFWSLFFYSMFNWISLRTAYRLRTACIASAFTKAMKSSITYKIDSHQVLMHAFEESDTLFALVLSGAQIFGSIFGVIIYYVASLVLLGLRGIWPLWAIIGLVIGTLSMAKISGIYMRRSLSHSVNKLKLIVDLCRNFATIRLLTLHNHFRQYFIECVTKQYSSLYTSHLYGTKFCGGLTSGLILGALYIIWCDANIETNVIPTLLLILMYAHFVQNLVLEFCESTGNIFNGKQSLDMLKQLCNLAPSEPSRSKPSKHLQVYISQAQFEWDHPQAVYMLRKTNEMHSIGARQNFFLDIDEMFIPKNQIVGITGASGSGKTALCYAILGHMKALKGNIFSRGRLAFFPQHHPYMKPGTIKENIVFGSEFDSVNYYKALSLANLNDDICSQLGKDDVPLKYLQLTAEQLQCIDLARAVYNDGRDLFIFDAPLNCMENDQEAAVIFKNVSDYLIQTGKTVIVTTTNELILKLCNRIYMMDKGHLTESFEYDDLDKIMAFKKIISSEKQLKLSYQDDSLVEQYLQNETITDDNSSINQSKSYLNKDLLMDEYNYKLQNRWLTICECIVLAILFLLNSFTFIYLPYGFIEAVKIEYVKLWPILICIAAVALTVFINILTKYSVNKAAQKASQSYQKEIYDKIIESTIMFVNSATTSDIINILIQDKFKVFQVYANCMQYMMMVFVTAGLLVYTNVWNSVLVIGITWCFIQIYRYLRFTVKSMVAIETSSRCRMFSVLENTLEGRAVIQAFEKLDEFRNDFYQILEDNSMAIFLRRSVALYGDFIFAIVQVIGLTVLCTIQFLRSDYMYQISLDFFAYFSLVYNMNKLLNVLFDWNITMQSLKEANQYSTKILSNLPGPLDFNPINRRKENMAISISFDSVNITIDGKSYLNIRKLHIIPAEKVGLEGTGVQFISKMLCGVMRPTKGVIFLGQYDLKTFAKEYFEQNIGFVPANPKLGRVSIRNVVDPRNDYLSSKIFNALQRFGLREIISKLPKDLEEPFEILSHKDRQLMCLIRCFLQMPAVIVIEYPHPGIQDIVNETIDRYFVESTVIIIGTNNTQFSRCHRIVDLDLHEGLTV